MYNLVRLCSIDTYFLRTTFGLLDIYGTYQDFIDEPYTDKVGVTTSSGLYFEFFRRSLTHIRITQTGYTRKAYEQIIKECKSRHAAAIKKMFDYSVETFDKTNRTSVKTETGVHSWYNPTDPPRNADVAFTPALPDLERPDTIVDIDEMISHLKQLRKKYESYSLAKHSS